MYDLTQNELIAKSLAVGSLASTENHLSTDNTDSAQRITNLYRAILNQVETGESWKNK